MTKFEWIQRARMHFAKRTKNYDYDWQDHAEVEYEVQVEDSDFKQVLANHPEEAVDEEISCWD